MRTSYPYDTHMAGTTPTAKKKDQPKTDTIQERFPFRHSLDSGNSGILVMWAQGRLMAEGQYEGELNGRYTREVSLAVRQFQSDNGLRVTGVIDRRTWTVLAGEDDATD
jgi:peptidoglycan hydrolase-like protein with peptidoglycan-binding domain